MKDTLVKSTASPEAKNRPTVGVVLRQLLGIPEVGVLIPLLLFIAIFYLINPSFLSMISVTTMLRTMSFIGIIAIGQTLLLAAIVSSYVMVKMNLPVPIAILSGLGTGALVGAINSFNVLKLGVPPFIATLGMLYIAKGITFLISKGKVKTITKTKR